MVRANRFVDLVRHFFDRFFDKEALSPQGEPQAGIIQTLGILAVPSAFIGLLVMPLSMRYWDLVGCRTIFISFSMLVMGFVMVFEWDALFPDRRDYQILIPLPLRLPLIFLAKLAALVIFLAMFLADINFFGVLFWPAIEGGKGSPLWVTVAHLIVVIAAGLFTALAIAAVQGIIVTVFRGATYRRVSVAVQTVLMALLVMCFFITPLVAFSLRFLARDHSRFIYYFPPYWFAGLYERLRPALSPSNGEVLRGLGGIALPAILWAASIFLVTFLPAYRRIARRVLEAPEPSPKGPGVIGRAWTRALHGLLVRDSVEAGVFHFITETLTRSAKHRLFLATYGGFGAALAVITWNRGGRALDLPFMLSFILISGLRAAFNFPSELAANWAFQVSETSAVEPYLRATRKWVAVYAVLPLFALLAVVEAVRFQWPTALFHFAFGVTVSLVLMEVLFLGFCKAPFTCSHFPGKVNLVFLSVLYLFGFTLYSGWMALLEYRLWQSPVLALLFFILAAAGLWMLARQRRVLSARAVLAFEETGNPVVRTLDLSVQ